MRLSQSLVVVSLLVAGQAHAQKNDQVHRGRVPAWVNLSELLPVPENPGGAAFIRRQDILVRLNAEGQEQYEGYRIRILHANALQLGNLSLTWNPAAGAPTVHSVKVYRGGETTDVLKDTSFEILRREDQLEAARLNGLLTAVLRIPDLRVGDEVEVEMTTLASDPSLGKNNAGTLFLAPSPAAGRYHLGLSWDAGRQPGLKMSAEMTAAGVKREGGIDFRFDNPATVAPPKDARRPLPMAAHRRVQQFRRLARRFKAFRSPLPEGCTAFTCIADQA